LIAQVAHPVSKEGKRHLLAHLVKENNWQQVLVFCRTKHGANRLAQQLERDGIETAAIHGNKSQPQRMKALSRFKNLELQVLVATDIAARGIDIEALPHVVNYDLPHVPEDYVHRIGRTGRAGESGHAVSLVSGEDRGLLRDIERLIGKKIDERVIPGFEPGSQHAQPRQQQQQPKQRQPLQQQQRQQQPRQRNGSERRRPQSPMRGQPNSRQGQHQQPRQGQGQRRDHGRRDERFALPSERNLDQVRKDQLEYARQQAAAEQREEMTQEPQAPAQPEHRVEQPQRQERREKQVPALFGVVGRKG